MTVEGVDLVARNIVRFGGGFTRHVNSTMEKAVQRLDKEVTKHITNRDFSLGDLKRMGHPYAKKWGEKGLNIHTPHWTVHSHTGTLAESKETGVVPASISPTGQLKASAFVKMLEREAPYVIHVIYGTSKMIPRDFLHGSLDLAKEDINDILKSELRDFVFNFR